jgi:ribosomal protein S18 acetylase RimI-like enzyme
MVPNKNKKTITKINQCIITIICNLKDLGRVSNILTYGFFSQGTNFFTYQLERLKTYLSIESMFAHQQNLAKRDQQSIIMMVACRTTDGEVIGVCEIDNRLPQEKKQMLEYRPYMCNLAVDKKWRRKGIAKALVETCEEIVMTRWGAQKLYLKVREENNSAQLLYKSLGYSVLLNSQDDGIQEQQQLVIEYLGDGSAALVLYKNLDLLISTTSSAE